MAENFLDKVRERAYFKYLDRKSKNIPGDSLGDWDEAIREQTIEDKIAEEAYYHYLNGSPDPDFNWNVAKNEINYRLGFLAFYQHLSNLDKSPLENWVDAEKIYINQF